MSLKAHAKFAGAHAKIFRVHVASWLEKGPGVATVGGL